MYQVIIVIQVLVGLSVIGLVLMQHGKGADAGAAFGSGSSGSVFGAQGSASFLSRATAILAVVFFASSLGLAILSGHVEESTDIMDVPEDSFADVPLMNEDQAPMSVPSISDQQQSEEVPVAIDPVTPRVDEIVESTEVLIEQSMGGAMPESIDDQQKELLDGVSQ